MGHKEIVGHLERAHPEVTSGWWRQTAAVGYEQARGKRVVGETADAGFQVGVQKSIDAESRPGRTAIHAHVERLPDAETREAMRTRWRDALKHLAEAAE